VAQTRRRRRTKHRGNAAGVVEARGRTGRKPTAAEKRGGSTSSSTRASQKRAERYERPPTWRRAFNRALLASGVLFVVALLLVHSVAAAIVYFVVAALAYTPISYYTDLWLYRRNQRTKQGGARGRTGTK
jgi:Flp pilus assembly protein TadB